MGDFPFHERVHQREGAGNHPYFFVLNTGDAVERGRVRDDRQGLESHIAANDNAIQVDGPSLLQSREQCRCVDGMSLPLGLRAGRAHMNFQRSLTAVRRVVNQAAGVSGERQQADQGCEPPAPHVNRLEDDRLLYE